MVLIWIGLAVGIIIAVILISKIIKTPSFEAMTLNTQCKKCGYKTNGLKCPRCDNNSFYSNKYK